MDKTPIGKITHFFPKIGVAVLHLTAPLKIGDRIEIGGKTEPFQMTVESMQVEHKSIPAAKPGDDVGMKVAKPVKDGDSVFKLA
ncbi:MAG: translation elongation factor-like protein [Candidatus Aenigmatarchaeota archaeon]